MNAQAEKVPPYQTFIESSPSDNAGSEKPSFDPKHSGNLSYLSGKAGDVFRSAVISEEENESKHEDNLKDEVRGKRFWRVGGVGIWAYGLDAKEENIRERLWREWSDKHDGDDWIQISRKRTKFYNESMFPSFNQTKSNKKLTPNLGGGRHVRPLFTWKLVEKGQRLPVDALPIGNEQDGAVLYAARAWYQGGLHLGKCVNPNRLWYLALIILPGLVIIFIKALPSHTEGAKSLSTHMKSFVDQSMNRTWSNG